MAFFALISNNIHAQLLVVNAVTREFDLQIIYRSDNCLIGFYKHQNDSTAIMQRTEIIRQDPYTVLHIGSHPNADYSPEFSELCETILGPFALMRWHQNEQNLDIACDPLGQYQFYYVGNADNFVCASDAAFIAACKVTSIKLNKNALACWLAGQPNPGISMYEDIAILPMAYRLRLETNGKIRLHKFWDIDPNQRKLGLSDQEYAKAFNAVLTQAVNDHIASNSTVIASQMSGGMDSSSITALATSHQHRLSNQLISLSHYYANSPDSDESEAIRALQRSLQCDHSLMMAADKSEYRDFMQLYPTDFDCPGTVLSSRYYDEFSMIEQHNASLLLTGNGGDEMCWGHALAYTQRLKQGELNVVKEVYAACKQTKMSFTKVCKNVFLRPFLPQWLLTMATRLKGHQPNGLPLWLTTDAKEAAETSLHISNPFDQKREPVHYARYHTLKTTATFNSVRSYQKVGAKFGIAVAHPFFDRNIAQFSFAVPVKQLIRGPYPKWLLRQAMTDILPTEVCWNTHKTTFDQHFTGLVKENYEAIRHCLANPLLADLGLLNLNLLLREFDSVVQGQNKVVTVDLLYAILTQCWITQHHAN